MNPSNANTSESSLLSPELGARVRQIQLRTRKLVDQGMSGAYRSTFRGSGIEFEEVRPYMPGDDVRTIDWNRTAGSEQAFVKTYVEERELSILFVVDQGLGMDFGSTELTKREAAAQLVAVLSFVALQAKDRVGLHLFDHQPGLFLSPNKGQSSVSRLLREVIAGRATERAEDQVPGAGLEEVLRETGRILHRRSLIFLLSDFHDSGWQGRGRDAKPEWASDWPLQLKQLAAKHDVIGVRVYDPIEMKLPKAGWLRLADPNNGQGLDLDTRSAKVREAWARTAKERRAALGAEFTSAGTDLIDISAAGDVAAPLVAYFQSRGKRRRGRR